ncbi:MAG: DUF1501 domain-containing protein [Bacteroidota bacterium]
MDIKNINRRQFLGTASCAAVGYSTLLSTLINLKGFNAAAIANSSVAAGGDYKALVCVVLGGGADSFNMMVPTNTEAYNNYAVTRSNLALPRNELLGINPLNTNGQTFGLHPDLGELHSLFNQNKLSFLANVGTLVQPTTKQQVWDESVPLPLGLFSHSDQMQQWQTGLPHVRSTLGWGGRIADMIRDMNDNENISMNISLRGTNTFQIGSNTIEYSIDPYRGSVGIEGYSDDLNEWDVYNRVRTEAVKSMIESQYQDMFKKTYVDVIRNSRDAQIEFQQALDGAEELNTMFADNYLAQTFRMIARTISVQQALGMKRQTFFVDFSGWDNHDELLANQGALFPVLSNALNSFNDALEELNMSDCVTTFTMSEFGRTLTSNGNGTDHAWGGNVMVMGGAVNGGNVFGTYPDLTLDSEVELGYGTLVPTTSTDVYFAELAKWFGVADSELTALFPNLENFYNVGSGMPLGFLNL